MVHGKSRYDGTNGDTPINGLGSRFRPTYGPKIEIRRYQQTGIWWLPHLSAGEARGMGGIMGLADGI